jgi:hypothetical protein
MSIMSDASQLRQAGFGNADIVTYLFSKFGDPDGYRPTFDRAIGVLEGLKQDKKGDSAGLTAAYSNLCAIAHNSGTISGSLRDLERNWNKALAGALGENLKDWPDRYARIRPKLLAMFQENSSRRKPTVELLEGLIQHFSLRAFSEPATLPSRYLNLVNQAGAGIVAIGLECRSEITHRMPYPWISPPPIDDIYRRAYSVTSGEMAKPVDLEAWKKIDWGDFREKIDTSLGSFDWNRDAAGKGVCQYTGMLIEVASGLGFIVSILTVNPVLAGICVTGLGVGAVLATKPEDAIRIVEAGMKKS